MSIHVNDEVEVTSGHYIGMIGIVQYAIGTDRAAVKLQGAIDDLVVRVSDLRSTSKRQHGSSFEIMLSSGYVLRAVPLEDGMVRIEGDDGQTVSELAAVPAGFAYSFAICLTEAAEEAGA